MTTRVGRGNFVEMHWKWNQGRYRRNLKFMSTTGNNFSSSFPFTIVFFNAFSVDIVAWFMNWFLIDLSINFHFLCYRSFLIMFVKLKFEYLQTVATSMKVQGRNKKKTSSISFPLFNHQPLNIHTWANNS